MEKKIKFGSIIDGSARLNGDVPIDPKFISGFPRKGVELVGYSKKIFSEYDKNGNLIEGSQDSSRVTRLIFEAYSLRELLRDREDLKNGDMTLDEYQDSVDSLPSIEVYIDGEELVNEFMDLYAKLLDGLDKGKVYDVKGGLKVTPKWEQYGWPSLKCGFSDISKLKFEEFDQSSLKEVVEDDDTK
ncbi:hypothetical protein [Limosilactobacillus reuteri]|uniref:hypothetical protein n=1 Tax=Limosilactobacillus reuteri TaxID=1598 RepID=UPI003F230E02